MQQICCSMRAFLCIYFSVLLCNVAFTQEKHNYTWLSGFYAKDNRPDATMIAFTDSSASLSLIDKINGGLFGSSVMSDKDGNLLFYSDGCFISNKLHQTMENGDAINTPGWAYQDNCALHPDIVPGYLTSQGVLALPWPGQKDRYLLFHFYDGDDVQQHFQLWYSIVDMGANNGLGRVLDKNKLLYKSDFQLDDGFTAVRHGNGRDWWLFCANDKNTYIRFLLSHKGIEGPFFQEVGGEALREMGLFNQFVFSPDGNWFARTNANFEGGVLLMRFDRCAGRFYQPKYIRHRDGIFLVRGAAFSHDSRYLYFNVTDELFQYDMDWVSSNNKPVSVGVYDGFIDNFPTNFFRMMLAPDKKIYICAGNGVSSFHVIHRPDLPEPACDFVQRGLPLGSFNAIGLNNNPFYQLYNLPESQCDTLGIMPPPGYESSRPWTPEQGISLHPNPANERAYLALAAGYGGRLRVYNPLGQLVYGFNDWQGPQGIELPTAEWPAGLYYIELYYEAFGPRRFVEPLVVVH